MMRRASQPVGMVDRDRRLNVRFSDEEMEMLHALAEKRGLTAADYVRQFIREAYESEFSRKKR